MDFSVEVKNARAQVLSDKIDKNGAKLVLYNSEKEVVCELDFKVPSKSSIENGVLVFNTLDESMVIISDDVTSAEIVSSIDDVLAFVSVSALDDIENQSADLKLASTTLYAGTLLRLIGWKVTEL